MKIIFLLILLSLFMGGLFVWAFFWAFKTGQFDDDATPAMRILNDDADKSISIDPHFSKP